MTTWLTMLHFQWLWIYFSWSFIMLLSSNFQLFTWKISNIWKNMVLQKNLHSSIMQFQQLLPDQSCFRYILKAYHPPLSYLKANCRLHIISSVNISIYISKTKASFKMWLQNSLITLNISNTYFESKAKKGAYFSCVDPSLKFYLNYRLSHLVFKIFFCNLFGQKLVTFHPFLRFFCTLVIFGFALFSVIFI